MNARIERVMNFENLGAKIMRNRALDEKIWALEAFKDKAVILGGSGGICGILEWLEGLGAKEQGLLRNLRIFWWFFGILEGLEGFRTCS
jgi:hypothetical protein